MCPNSVSCRVTPQGGADRPGPHGRLSPGALHAQIQAVVALPQDLPEERIRRDQEPDPVAAERRAAEIGQVILGLAVEDRRLAL